MNLLKLASIFEKLAISSTIDVRKIAQTTAQKPAQPTAAQLQVEASNYALILNIYNQIQDIATLISRIQFSEDVKNTLVRMQKLAFDFATKVFDSGLDQSQASAYFSQVKSSFESVKSKVPQNVFKPFDLLNQMLNVYKPMALSAQSKNNGKKPAPLVAINLTSGTGRLPSSISVQMPVK